MPRKGLKYSVIIPVYNAERYLLQCLESVAGQTLKDIEIICVNNGSEDNSLNLLKKFAKNDRRVIYTSIPKSNAGIARNVGLSMASGKYLYFIDSDDFCNKELLEECYIKIEKEKSDVLVFAADQFDTISGKYSPMPYSLEIDNLPKKSPFGPEEIKNKLFNSFQNWPWNKVFRREFIIENNISFQDVARTNDMLFTISALAKAKLISVVNKVLVHYRTGNKNSLQSTNYLTPIAFWDAFREAKKFLHNNGYYDLYKKSFLNEIMGGLTYNYNSIKDDNAQKYLYNVIRYGEEIEFGLLKQKRDYYWDKDAYDFIRVIVEGKTSDERMIDELKERNKALEDEIKHLEMGISEIKNSKSMKIGLAVTSVPRKIESIVKKFNS